MKIFKKEKDGNKRTIYFCGIKIWSYCGKVKNFQNKITYNNKKIAYAIKASDTIYNYLNSNKPCLISRWGTTEADIVKYYMTNTNKKHLTFPEDLKNNLSVLSGFFPLDDKNIQQFCKEALKCSKEIDCLAVRCRTYEMCFWDLEEYFCKNSCINANYVDIESLTDFNVENPWTRVLKGKKVLIIHPFESTIINQYKKREFLFKNPNILPEFELNTLKAVQSLADAKNDLPYSSWFEALDDMCKKIDKIDFDIAIIGAGAYGMFLGAHCKNIGKKAIHIGGATQVLFGIKGKRYDANNYWIHDFYNESWVYPNESEKPKGLDKVEGGCYW